MADCSSLGLREMCCFEFVEFYKVVDSAPWYSLPLNVTVISLACVAMAMTVGANKKTPKNLGGKSLHKCCIDGYDFI